MFNQKKVHIVFIVIGFTALLGYPAHDRRVAAQELEAFHFDFDGDGNINSTDLLQFMRMWGLQGVATPTPEPTGLPSDCENPFQDSYNGTFSGGGGSGTVALAIDAMGRVTGMTTAGPDKATVEGAISCDGAFVGKIIEAPQVIGIVYGTFSGNRGNGQWRDLEGESGTWSVTRTP
jgi:hypothetical protein